MIYLCIASLSDWLRDPNTSPNVHLAALTLEEDDLALPLPPIAAVFDPFRDRQAFDFTEPGRYPALIVSPAGPVEVEGEVNVGEQNGDSFPVAVRVVVGDIHGPSALRQLSYYLTALNRCVSAYLASDAAGEAARVRGHAQVVACNSRSYALAAEDIGAAKVGAILLLNLFIRDTEAT